MSTGLELVVARYREELNWLRKVPPVIQKTIYNKNPGVDAPDDGYPGGTPLPNVGREAQTYLWHLVRRYDDLADVTIFCQGKPFDHAYDFHHRLRAFAAAPESVGTFDWMGHTIDTDDDRGERLFKPWSKNEDGRGLDLRGFHRALFGSDGPAWYPFVLGAQFAIRRKLIQSRPREFYERALRVSETFPDAAHCFERSWNHVFGVPGIDPDWLAGRLTVQLKPVKGSSVP